MNLLKAIRNVIARRAREGAQVDELEMNIQAVQDPFGDPSHMREAERAARYLLEHPDEAHPRLLALLASNRAANPSAIIELLPRFERIESVPVLESILAEGLESVSGTAATALARHPATQARDALVRSLSLSAPETVKAAADGLGARGDREACPALRGHLEHEDAEVRYHVMQAAIDLGCLDRQALASIAARDVDDDIRGLAERALRD